MRVGESFAYWGSPVKPGELASLFRGRESTDSKRESAFPDNLRFSWNFLRKVCQWTSSHSHKGFSISTVKVNIWQIFIIHKANWNLFKAWFPFELFVPSVARFGYSSSDVCFCFLLFFVAFCCFRCFSLLVVALSGFSLLLMSTTFYRSRVEANQWKWEWKIFLLSFLLLVFVLGACFRLQFVAFTLLLFVARTCFWDRISSISKTKTGKCLWFLVLAFCCSFWFLQMFP